MAFCFQKLQVFYDYRQRRKKPYHLRQKDLKNKTREQIDFEGAFKNNEKLPLRVNNSPEKSLKVVASKSHLSDETQAFIDDLAKGTQSIDQVSKGSSLKLVMVAEGVADIYPRLAPTMEWDTAAADAIVRESGKMTYQFENDTHVVYNKENLLNPWFVVR